MASEFYIRYFIIVLVFLLVPYFVIAEDHLDESATQTQIQSQQELARQQEQDIFSKLLTAKAESLRGSKQGQCVVAVRNFLGVGRDEIQGWAKNTKINSQSPEVGAIIVINASYWGHVGVVLFTTEDKIWYYDSNGDWHQRANIRSISISDKRIKGFRIVE